MEKIDINKIISPELIDIASRTMGLNGIGTATYSTINGLNTIPGASAIPVNTDHQGYTFFTKPCLNLSYHNVINIRELAFLADRNLESMASVIRCTLNPKGYDRYFEGGIKDPDGYGDDFRSIINDDLNPFIPLLGNNLISLSGWRDLTFDSFTSKESYSKSQVSFIDSAPEDFSTFDLTANFSNMEGDPITVLFKVWMLYAARVAEGSMIPFPINIVENRVDYNTRIYRLVMDRTNRYVQRIAATGASFPNALPLGGNINFNRDILLSEENNQISIPFRCMGAIYDDPILIDEFNTTVVIRNNSMHDKIRSDEMHKLNNGELITFNNKPAYPRISETNELEWWVFNDVKNKMDTLLQAVSGNPTENITFPQTSNG